MEIQTSSVTGDSHWPHLNHMGRAWLVPARVLAMWPGRLQGWLNGRTDVTQLSETAK